MAITYYDTGIITLTNGSAVVTGTGTAWQTAMITGGVILVQTPDGHALPIKNVDSNTQITAGLLWAGATDQYLYAIARQDDVNQVLRNAQALSEYVQRLDSDALGAIAGLPPQAESIAVFTGQTTAEIRPLSSAFTSDNLSYAGRGATLIAEGDSLSAGYLLPDPGSQSWFAQFMGMQFAAGAIASYRPAVSGSKIQTDIPARYNALVRPHRPAANGGDGGAKAFLHLQGGTNDIVAGRTAAQIISDLTSYTTTAKADGFTVVVGTITPSLYLSGMQEDIRLAINAAIRRGDTGANFAWAMDDVITNPSDPAICPDGGHYSLAASTLLAKHLDRGMREGFATSATTAVSKFGIPISPAWELIGKASAPPGTVQTIWTGLGAYRRVRLTWDILPTDATIGVRTSRNNGATWDQGAGDYTYHGFAESAAALTPIAVNNIGILPLVDTGMGNNMAEGQLEMAAFNTTNLGTFHSQARYWSSPTVAHRSTTLDGYVGVSGVRNAIQFLAFAGSYGGVLMLEGLRG